MKFHKIFLDFDGVVVNSNNLKLCNINKAVEIVSGKSNQEFLLYFQQNSGLSRRSKIEKYFNSAATEEIIGIYNDLNKKNYCKLIVDDEVRVFLEQVSTVSQVFIVSGGKVEEIIEILNINNIKQYIENIYGDSCSKEQHFMSLFKNDESAVFIGDSKYDYLVSNKFGIPFFFYSKYTDVEDWENFCKVNNVNTISHLNQVFDFYKL